MGPSDSNPVVRSITRYIELIAHGMWLLSYVGLVLMMLLTTVDVFGRYCLKHPVRDGLEMTQFLLVVTVASAMGFTQILKGHISVNLVTRKLPQSWRNGCEALGNLICLVLFALFSWQAAIGAREKHGNGITTGSYDLPLWPFYAFLALGCCVTSLAFLSDLLKLCRSGEEGR